MITRRNSTKRRLKLFMQHDLTRTFDVVVSRSRGPYSKKLAWASSGTFSHASLILSPLFWFDAQPEGVGYHSPSLTLAFGHDAMEMRSYQKLAVLRHPIVELLSENRAHELAMA